MGIPGFPAYAPAPEPYPSFRYLLVLDVPMVEYLDDLAGLGEMKGGPGFSSYVTVGCLVLHV